MKATQLKAKARGEIYFIGSFRKCIAYNSPFYREMVRATKYIC